MLGLQGYDILQRYGSADAVGVMVALSLEFSNRRVRSADDLHELRDVVLLGSIGPARGMMKPAAGARA